MVTSRTIDLVAASRLEGDETSRLRRWAACRLDTLMDSEPTLVRLDPTAIRALARVCGMSTRSVVPVTLRLMQEVRDVAY